MENIIILFIGLVILLIVSYIMERGNMISPSVMMCIMFLVSTGFAIINVKNWNIDYSLTATALILSGILIFSFAEFVPSISVRKKQKNIKFLPNEFEVENWKIICLFIFSAILVYFEYREIVRITGVSGIRNLSAMIGKYKDLNSYSTALHGGKGMNSIVSHMMLITTVTAYIYMFLFSYGIVNGNRKILKYIPSILLYYTQSFLTGGREFFFRTICVMLVSMYVLSVKKNVARKTKVNIKFLICYVIMAITILPLFYSMQSIIGRRLKLDMLEYLSVYAGGSIQGFNLYIKNPPAKNRVFGEESFVYVYTFLKNRGLGDFSRTIHLEFRNFNAYSKGNVYTFFRRLIQDFGYIGMYIATFFIGLFYGFFYHHKLMGEKKTYSLAKNIIVFSFFYYVIIMSSIEQMIFNIFSMNVILTLVLINMELWFLIKFKLNYNLKIVIKRYV